MESFDLALLSLSATIGSLFVVADLANSKLTNCFFSPSCLRSSDVVTFSMKTSYHNGAEFLFMSGELSHSIASNNYFGMSSRSTIPCSYVISCFYTYGVYLARFGLSVLNNHRPSALHPIHELDPNIIMHGPLSHKSFGFAYRGPE